MSCSMLLPYDSSYTPINNFNYDKENENPSVNQNKKKIDEKSQEKDIKVSKENYLRYNSALPKKTELETDNLSPLRNALEKVKVKVLEEDLLALQKYVHLNTEYRCQEAQKCNQSIFIGSNDDLPRSILFTADGKAIIHFNRRKNKGDPLIGEGRFKKVTLAIDYFSGQVFASAGINNQSNQGEFEYSQAMSVRGMAGVLQTSYGVLYESGKGSKVRLLTSYCNQGCLSPKIVKELNINQKKDLCIQLIKTLISWHHNNFLHRDLKAENILVNKHDNQYQAFFSDFGSICQNTSKDKLKEYRTSVGCVSPEYAQSWLMQQGPLPISYDFSAVTNEKLDVWAMGTILETVMTGKSVEMITKEKSSVKIGQKARTTKLFFELVANRMIQKEPEDKKTMEHLIWRMAHPDPAERTSTKELAETIKDFKVS